MSMNDFFLKPSSPCEGGSFVDERKLFKKTLQYLAPGFGTLKSKIGKVSYFMQIGALRYFYTKDEWLRLQRIYGYENC